MFSLKTFVSGRRAADPLAQIRWRDGGSRRIKTPTKANSHPTSGRFNCGSVFAATPAMKR